MQNPSNKMSSVRNLVAVAFGAILVVMVAWMYIEKKNCQLNHMVDHSRSHEELAEARVLLQEQRNLVQELKDIQRSQPQEPPRDPLVVELLEMKKAEENATQKRLWDYNWDQRAWKNPEDSKKVADRVIVLVRHGEYDFKTGLLTDKGKQQANMTGQRLKDLKMAYVGLTHSTMDRARETAEIIRSHFPNLPITTDAMLEEGGPLPPQPTITYWSLSDEAYHKDGPRLEAAFRKYFHRAPAGQDQQTFDIIVAHANIIRFFVLRALQLPPEAWMRLFMAHGSISLLHLNSDGTVALTRFGDAGHFPPHYLTS